MYGWYAYDPRMRSNVGIRRRLAPLLDNSRAELELAHALLFSLQGQPVPVLRRRDRHGRQHLAARPRHVAHAHAVDARPQRRVLERRPRQALPAVVQSLVYNYSLVNVESQLAQSRSLLHWVRNVIHVRKAHPTFGLGRAARAARPTTSRCSRSCASTRAPETTFGDSPRRMLCVFSFAHNPVAVTMSRCEGYEGATTFDLFGGGEFPRVGDDGQLHLTLGTQSFFWLHLGDAQHQPPR